MYVLRGGYDAWKAEILTAPKALESPTAAQSADYNARTALYAHFTGTAATAGPARSNRDPPPGRPPNRRKAGAADGPDEDSPHPAS